MLKCRFANGILKRIRLSPVRKLLNWLHVSAWLTSLRCACSPCIISLAMYDYRFLLDHASDVRSCLHPRSQVVLCSKVAWNQAGSNEAIARASIPAGVPAEGCAGPTGVHPQARCRCTPRLAAHCSLLTARCSLATSLAHLPLGLGPRCWKPQRRWRMLTKQL